MNDVDTAVYPVPRHGLDPVDLHVRQYGPDDHRTVLEFLRRRSEATGQ